MIEYKMCPHCVMDTKSDPSIVFESNGKCERCNMYENTVFVFTTDYYSIFYR